MSHYSTIKIREQEMAFELTEIRERIKSLYAEIVDNEASICALEQEEADLIAAAARERLNID